MDLPSECLGGFFRGGGSKKEKQIIKSPELNQPSFRILNKLKMFKFNLLKI